MGVLTRAKVLDYEKRLDSAKEVTCLDPVTQQTHLTGRCFLCPFQTTYILLE